MGSRLISAHAYEFQLVYCLLDLRNNMLCGRHNSELSNNREYDAKIILTQEILTQGSQLFELALVQGVCNVFINSSSCGHRDCKQSAEAHTYIEWRLYGQKLYLR